jgi:hypothetical protein
MSSLIGLPFALSSHRLTGLNHGLQLVAGILTIGIDKGERMKAKG